MILARIVKDNLKDLDARKRRRPLGELQALVLELPPSLDLATALLGEDIKLIADVKKASPSRGVIRHDFNPVEIARTYAASGAAAISVVTESRYFQGSLDHLAEIRKTLGTKGPPLLRKDFIHDPYQVYEARAYGADSILLIAAMLTAERLRRLLGLSHELGMGCLVEVHNETELETALKSHASIIGINNRDLSTFAVDITTTERLRPLIPADRIVVSESGISDHGDIDKMRQWGVDAVLVGESLMSAPDIAAKVKELLCSS